MIIRTSEKMLLIKELLDKGYTSGEKGKKRMETIEKNITPDNNKKLANHLQIANSLDTDS